MNLQKNAIRIIIRVILFVIPLILILIFILTLTEKPFVLFPDLKGYYIDGNSDSSIGGASIVDRVEIYDDYLIFKYTLKKGIKDPFAYLYINPWEKTRGLNLSSYDYLTIKIASSASKSVKLVLKTSIPGITDPSDPASFLPLEKEIMTLKEISLHKIPLNGFIGQTRWYQKYNTLKESIIQKDFLKFVSSFEIHSSTMQLNFPDTLTIEWIAFHKIKTGTYISIAVCFGLYCLGIILALLIKKIRS